MFTKKSTLVHYIQSTEKLQIEFKLPQILTIEIGIEIRT